MIAIPVAAGVFSSWGLTLRPEIGALAMSGSSILVAFNATLLKGAQFSTYSETTNVESEIT
jgi:Cu2+-exporting ATPase